MAKDYHIRGYNTPQMARVANHYKKLLGISDGEQVDIIDILEFKVVKIHPKFRLVVKRDNDFADEAYTNFDLEQIIVRESVYIAAHEGDPRSRMILAHELGHYLLHRGKGASMMHKTRDGAYESMKGLNATESTEIQADMFAQHFLVHPATAFTFRQDPIHLASLMRVPVHVAKAAISASKRLSVRNISQTRISLLDKSEM
ncbi:ImmA/IrrE family metallo-endopeptidase [Rhizobium sp. FKY42]|uniref:ImmA/IrrE family metallo-endopeptidase n=1 Tax=Rhizobium sp. FKY42 TaxID=2562310 RepID=UPI0010BF9414|nr:ImmA/IrrE family metallo-endopeptidase [Rhizobium sp. FKY42]